MELFTEQKAKRKVVKIPAEDFIRLTLLDVMHDADFLTVSAAAVSHCAVPYANWIFANNPGKFTDLWQIVETMRAMFTSYIGLSITDAKQKIGTHYLRQTTEVKPASISIVIDTCKKGIFFCDKKGSYATLTQSTYYDRGSFNQTCSGTRKFVEVERQDYAFYNSGLNAAISAHDELDSRDYATVLSCKNKARAPALDVRDLYVVGVLRGVLCILAFRGAYTSKISPEETAIVFYQRIQPKWISARGWAASAANTKGMLAAWKKCEPYSRIRETENEAAQSSGRRAAQLQAEVARLRAAASTIEAHWDACRLWSELAAKQWGDLGLAVDTVDVKSNNARLDWYVSTEDKLLQSFCILLGASIISGGTYRRSKLSASFAFGQQGAAAEYGSAFYDLDSLKFMW
jgi:hypothetical protein